MIGILIIFSVVWMISGAFTYAITFGHFQREFPHLAEECREEQSELALLIGLCGPIGLYSVILYTGFAKHGLKWR